MVKYLFLLSIAFAAMASTCKQARTDEGGNLPIHSKWKVVKTFASPGDASLIWNDYSGPAFYLGFDADGNFSSSQSIHRNKEFNRYKLVDDKRIHFYHTLHPDTVNLSFEIADSKLKLYQQCIEACGILLEPAKSK